tara:strand:+ start:37623 stop:38318 length:696 start_codon:yes stop_codon:yes gene_type:complete
MKKKYIVRATFPDGTRKFIGENRRESKYLFYLNSIKGEFNYDSSFNIRVTRVDFPATYENVLEFRVSLSVLKPMGIGVHTGKYAPVFKRDVDYFEFIDTETLEAFKINIDEPIEFNERDLYFNESDFKRLLRCPISCSHWLHDENGEWVAFPKEEDFERIESIRYYKRGLTHTLWSGSAGQGCRNWSYRNEDHSWHPTYELHHKLMKNPIIQKLALTDIKECESFNCYKAT